VAALCRGSAGLAASKFVSHVSGEWGGARQLTLGSRVDSYYEYLLKGWLAAGAPPAHPLLTAYQDAVHSITLHLLQRSRTERLLFVAERSGDERGPLLGQVDHLVCFYPGLLALGHAAGVRPRPEQRTAQAAALQRLGFSAGASQLDVAAELAAGCRQMYRRNPLGLGPEIAFFALEGEPSASDGDVLVKPGDAHSLLRPEFAESLFVLHRATRNATYRDWAWEVWQGIEQHARVPSGGYASVESVLQAKPVLRDSMESFFLAETAKYLLLVFAEEERLDLKRWVFNTEAHPLPRA